MAAPSIAPRGTSSRARSLTSSALTDPSSKILASEKLPRAEIIGYTAEDGKC